jgi:hypothetical protein
MCAMKEHRGLASSSKPNLMLSHCLAAPQMGSGAAPRAGIAQPASGPRTYPQAALRIQLGRRFTRQSIRIRVVCSAFRGARSTIFRLRLIAMACPILISYIGIKASNRAPPTKGNIMYKAQQKLNLDTLLGGILVLGGVAWTVMTMAFLPAPAAKALASAAPQSQLISAAPNQRSLKK